MTILDSLFKYASKLVSSTESVETFRVVSPQELDIWNQVETTCKKIDKHQKSVGEDKSKSAMFEAFQLMLQLFGLHLYIVESSERAEVMDTIQEITTCFSKAVSRTRTNKEEPEWCEVITEVLISLMSKSSHLLRTVSTSVFTKILPMCNTASIQLILDVFQSEDDEFDADREEVMMEEDVTSPDETDVSETAGDGGEDSSTSSDESDDEDEEEQGEEVDENMRATLQAALGPAAITDADQEDDDLSDSEMFKLDDALCAAFRGMMSKNKNSPAEVEKRRQIIYFKLRCLDLVEVIVKHSTDGEHLMELVVPLLTITEASYKEKEMKEIGKKAQTLYNHLTSLKKIPTATVTDLDRATDRVKDILTLSTNAYVWPIMKDLANGLNLMKGKDVLIAAVVGEVQAALKEFLNKRESKYSHTLFQSLFDRQAPLFWGSNSDLLEAISNEGVRVFCRTQACSLLSQLINRTVTSQDNGATWLKFTKSLQVAIEKVSKYSAVNYKAGFLPEFFGVLNKVKTVDKTVVLDLGSFEGISEKFNKDLQKLYRKLVSANSQPAVGVSPGRKRKVSATFSSSDSDKPTKAMKTP
ncbi:MYBBP1A [Bugula neritina]|uniref:MYBBP1A n=1 Tax=Bugula neritina TaxID=10212 RepID=A0A7J7KKB4_BUGNE|nr:MYBBP1A [Bugula neritina]